MSWYNPLSWGQHDPEMYDPDSANARAARTFGGPRNDYDVQGEQAQGQQLDQTRADQARGQQQRLAGLLEQGMQGQGPSAADAAAQGQQRAALANAAALNAGARGRSSIGGAIAGNAAASQGVQQAAQNQFVNKQQEMAQARGEYGNLAGNMRAQDLGAAGQNAQLAQNAAQYNAANRQQATLANQAARLGISQQEMAARQHQGDMEFTNLDPGSKGYFPDIALAAGNLPSMFARGGVVDGLPRYGGGVAVGGSSPTYQTMGIGTRRVPISKGDLDQGRALAQSVISFVGAFKAGQNPLGLLMGDKGPQAPSGDSGNGTSAAAPAYAQGPMTGPNDGPVTSPMQVDPSLAQSTPVATSTSTAPVTQGTAAQAPVIQTPPQEQPLSLQFPHPMGVGGAVDGSSGNDTQGMQNIASIIGTVAPIVAALLAKGGVVGHGPEQGAMRGPQRALVGEAGPEAIVDVREVVDRPTVTTLGANGRTQAVIPLSRGHEADRRRVMNDIVRLCNGGAMGGRR